jgi:two-component system OmpR family response regulator
LLKRQLLPVACANSRRLIRQAGDFQVRPIMSDNAPTDRTPGPGFRVLIVDDNKDAADSLAMLARLWGYEVRTAYDGAVALEMARAFQPDCMLLDLGLPGIDGYNLARQVRQQPALGRPKLVALSAYSTEDHRRKGWAAGFDHYLVKPADPLALEGLLKMLQQSLKLARQTEALAQQNVTLARQTKELLSEVKEEIKEVKEEIEEVKTEIKEVKESISREGAPGDLPS